MSDKMSSKLVDIESQPILQSPTKDPQSPSSLAMEYRIPARKKLMYLGGYFMLNLSLTLYNKALLGNVSCEMRILVLVISNNFSVQIPMASYRAAFGIRSFGMLCPGAKRLFHSHFPGNSRESRAGRILFPLHY